MDREGFSSDAGVQTPWLWFIYTYVR